MCKKWALHLTHKSKHLEGKHLDCPKNQIEVMCVSTFMYRCTVSTVNLYLLHVIVVEKRLFKKTEVGIYRDDGLSITRCGDKTANKLRENLEKTFKKN